MASIPRCLVAPEPDPAAAEPPPRPPGTLRRALLLLAVASIVAMAGTAAVVVLVSRADFLTGAAVAVFHAMFRHGAVAAVAASSPILAVLLIGYAYMMRGLRRRAAQKAAAPAAPVPRET
jgi:hypothetical protein